jgi:hypothetical protein
MRINELPALSMEYIHWYQGVLNIWVMIDVAMYGVFYERSGLLKMHVVWEQQHVLEQPGETRRVSVKFGQHIFHWLVPDFPKILYERLRHGHSETKKLLEQGMVLTNRERAFSNALKRLKRAHNEFKSAQNRYKETRNALRAEYGLHPYVPFGPYYHNLRLENRLRTKAARTVQRYARAATIRRRTAAASTLRKRLSNNTVKKILSGTS